MGGVVKSVGKAVGSIFGMDTGAAEKAANRQAAAAIAAAEKQAAATKAASDAQVAQINQQAQGAVQSQQAAINQANLSAQLRTQDQQNNQAPETKVETSGTADPDPRRKYRGAGGGSVGGTSGGIGIRLT